MIESFHYNGIAGEYVHGGRIGSNANCGGVCPKGNLREMSPRTELEN